MGIRIEFYEVPCEDIQEAIKTDVENMKSWYEPIVEEYPEDADDTILKILQEVNSEKLIFPQIAKEAIDELISFYLGDYCDYGPGKLRPITKSMLNLRYYKQVLPLIKRQCHLQAYELWKYILSGRSVIENQPFKISDDVFRFCIFSERECQILFKELTSNFNVSTVESFNELPAIGSMITALGNKKMPGLLITVA